MKDSLVLTGHVTYEELSSSAISKLQSPSIYRGGESYIVIPYLLGTPIRIVTSHKDPTVYVFYCNGQENIPVATVVHGNNHFQRTLTGMLSNQSNQHQLSSNILILHTYLSILNSQICRKFTK